jgi:hypothetical protein
MLSLQLCTARVAPHVRGAAPRALQRVFTDAEWDSAIKSSASKLAALEASFAKATVSGAPAVPAGVPASGKIFTDEEWDMVVKRAPHILTTMRGVEDDVVGATSGDLSTVPTGDRLFSEKQWESAIRRAVEAVSEVCH